MIVPANPAPGGGNPGPGGNGGGEGGGKGEGEGGGNNPPPNPDPKPGDSVSYATFSKVLDEKKAAKAEADALKARIAAFERTEAEKAGDWQKLVQIERDTVASLKAANAELTTKVQTIEGQHTQVRKLAALVKGAGGSVDSKWHELIADKFLSDIVVHPETGEIDQGSVTKAVEKLRAVYPEVIQGRVPGVPNGDPGAGGTGQPGTISRSQWLALPGKEMTKWKPHQIVG